MAILPVSTGSTTESTAQTHACQAPTGIITGNYLRLWAVCAAPTAVTISMVSSGWTQVDQIQTTAGLDGTLAVFIKKASAESGNYTVSIDGGVNRQIITNCSQYSGVDTTTPQDATATSTTDQSTADYNPPAITTVTANAYVESIFFGRAASLGIPSAPTGYTKYGTYAGTNIYCGAAYIDAGAAGSEDPGTWSSFSATADCCGITWAMRPSTGSSISDINFTKARRGVMRGVARGVG